MYGYYVRLRVTKRLALLLPQNYPRIASVVIQPVVVPNNAQDNAYKSLTENFLR